jgi:hypothetical protein
MSSCALKRCWIKKGKIMKLFDAPPTKFEWDPRKHPEIREGEMWLKNELECKLKDFLDSCNYKSKRVGKIAYNEVSGKKTTGFVPIFISKEEYKKFKEKLNKEREE